MDTPKAVETKTCIIADTKDTCKGDYKFLAMASILVLLLYPFRVPAVSVSTPPELLEIADFDQDGKINNVDHECLDYIVGTSRIPLHCLRIYNFGCSGLRGDLNQNGELDTIDLILEKWIIDNRVDYHDVFDCADMTADDTVDSDDLACMVGMVEGNNEAIKAYCTPCQQKAGQAGRYGDEICHDGLDNDCNGQIDDNCVCNELQPCGKRLDYDGLQNTDDFKYCWSLSWKNSGAWGWYWPEEVEECTMQIQCETKECDGRSWRCSSPGNGRGIWYKGALPAESDDPEASPRTCEDGWDNDCIGGDERCKPPEEGGMMGLIIVILIIAIILICVATACFGLFGGGAAAGAGAGASGAAMDTATLMNSVMSVPGEMVPFGPIV